jgi:hypothetical protein
VPARIKAWLARRQDAVDDVAGMPVPAAHFAALRADDAFIVSYPRSGNRWIRAILCDLIARTEGDAPAARAPDELRISDLHHVAPREVRAADSPASGPARIFKSHNIRLLAGRKMLYVFRGAADALVSYFHFRLKQPQWREKIAIAGIDDFCIRMLPGWCEHMELALDQKSRHPERTCMVSFELLKEDPERSVSAIAQFFGFSAPPAMIREVVAANAFDQKVRERGASDAAAKGPLLRKGRVGTGAEELRTPTLDQLAAASARFYDQAHAFALRDIARAGE